MGGAGRTVELSILPLLGVIRQEGLGPPHAMFVGGERYVSARFTEQAARALRQELAAAGLGERPDYLEFLDSLTVVQQAEREYYGWVTGVDLTYSVLVASVGRVAVTVVRSGDRVVVERGDVDRMVDDLVCRLPDVRVADGEPIAVRATEFDVSGRGRGTVMRRSGSARPEAARRLDGLLGTRRVSVAKLYAARRDDEGTRVRAERWLTVLDLVDGRWAVSVSQVKGQRWLHAAPGTDQHLVGRLVELGVSAR
jgi:ESX secretion-associated protein EspG